MRFKSQGDEGFQRSCNRTLTPKPLIFCMRALNVVTMGLQHGCANSIAKKGLLEMLAPKAPQNLGSACMHACPVERSEIRTLWAENTGCFSIYIGPIGQCVVFEEVAIHTDEIT